MTNNTKPSFAIYGQWRAVDIGNACLEVRLLPESGCDILNLVDLESGTDLLFKTPWAPGRRVPLASNSFTAWLEASSGGWNILLPNGGDAAVESGVEWGFHGEAGRIEWAIKEIEASRARFASELVTVPLEVEREISIDRNIVRIVELVTNTGCGRIEFMWGHHPSFGSPFLGPGCTIEVGATTFVADLENPGSCLKAGGESEWPNASLADGGSIDLSSFPNADAPRSVLGYLTEFVEPWFRFANPHTKLAITVRWSAEVFPYAWFWQELHSSASFPWFGRAYASAIEPSSSFPAHGITRARNSGSNLCVLEPGETREVTLEAEITHDGHLPRSGARPGGSKLEGGSSVVDGV